MAGLKLDEGHIDLTLNDRAFQQQTNKVQNKLKALNLGMQKVASQAKKMLLIGAGGMIGAIKAYADFQIQLAEVSTMLDDMTMQVMPGFTRGIKRLSVEFGESTKTLSKGLYDILSASIEVSKAMMVLEVSVKAATAGLTTTAIAADAITTILNSYRLSADQAGDVSDLLFAIVKRGKITFEELASRIGRVASIASQAGLSLEQVGAAIATMTRAGLQSDIAITSLRALLMAFISPTADAVIVAEKFGFELSAATLSAIGLTGVLKKLAGISAEQLSALMPNVRGMAGFAAALQDTVGQVSDLDLMFNRSGLTLKAFNKINQTLIKDLSRLWQAVKSIAVSFGSKFAPAIKEITEKIVKLTKEINLLIESKGKAIVKMVAWTGAILVGIVVLGKLFTIIKGIAAVIAFIAAAPILIPIAAAIAVVAIYKELGNVIGDIIVDMEGLEFRYKHMVGWVQKHEEAVNLVIVAEEHLKKAREAAETAAGGSIVERLTAEKKVQMALLSVEEKRIAALKTRLLTIPAGGRLEEGVMKRANAAKAELVNIKANIIAYDKMIRGIKEAALARKKTQKTDIEIATANEDTITRIRELELQILETRKDSTAELARINNSQKQAMTEWSERANKIMKATGRILSSTFFDEYSKIEELFSAKKQTLADKVAKEILEKDKAKAKELIAFRKKLEQDFQQQMSFLDPKTMFRRVTLSLNQARDTRISERLLEEAIAKRRADDTAEMKAALDRAETNRLLSSINAKKTEGSLSR